MQPGCIAIAPEPESTLEMALPALVHTDCPAADINPDKAVPDSSGDHSQIPEPLMSSKIKKGSLAAIVGVLAATTLYTITPQDESGRTVQVTLAPDGEPTITHVSGPQYRRAYLDIGGVATACDGIAQRIKLGQVYTEAQCTAMLDKALVEHAQGVMDCSPALRQPGRDWQRVAAVNHAYQFGVAGWCTSTAHRLIEQGKIAEGCNDLARWNKVRQGGVLQFSNGVQRRSMRRLEYCRTGLPGYPVETLQARLKPWK